MAIHIPDYGLPSSYFYEPGIAVPVWIYRGSRFVRVTFRLRKKITENERFPTVTHRLPNITQLEKLS